MNDHPSHFSGDSVIARHDVAVPADNDLRDELCAAQAEITRLKALSEAQRQQLDAVLASASWRITGPWRRIRRHGARLGRRGMTALGRLASARRGGHDAATTAYSDLTPDPADAVVETKDYEKLESSGSAELDAAMAQERIEQVRASAARLFFSDLPVLVFAGVDPSTADETEGFHQRVLAIDKVLGERKRLYIVFENDLQGPPALIQRDEKLWVLHATDSSAAGEAILQTLLELGASAYVHSVWSLQPASARKLLANRTGAFVLDLHGAVPEECQLQGDAASAAAFAEYEKFAAARIDGLVCVSRQMATHFLAKHAPLRVETIICPIFLRAEEAGAPRLPYNERPLVVYAGGAQAWQQTGKMVDTIARSIDRCDFTILTPDVPTFLEALNGRALTPDTPGLAVRSAAHADVLETFRGCDFGLLLREASIVNNVACPTKLVEYLAAGIVPILDSEEIGDFAALGLQHVSLAEFVAGRWPTPEQRRHMAAANLEVYHKLAGVSRAGVMQIARAVAPREPVHVKLDALKEKGFLALGDYDGPAIPPEEWLSLEYLDWKSGGDTNFAPLASANGAMECAGFWDFGRPDKDGVWTENAKKCPTLVAWTTSVGANYGRVRIIKLSPNSEGDVELNLHRDNNNALNPSGQGWVVRAWLELTDDPDSYMLLRERKDDPSTESRVRLHRNSQIIIDSQRLYHAVSHPGPEPRYALIVSFESGEALERWIAEQSAQR